MINIIVCMKQVIDPEAPPSSFSIDHQAKRAVPPKGTLPTLNPFDCSALEAALRIKDILDARITVVSMGSRLAKSILEESLAVGADELILLEDHAFDDFDSYFTAHILATAINKIGEYDLILCGSEASDTDAAQVGSGIAEILGIPSITMSRKIEVDKGKIKVERGLSDGYQLIEAPMPTLVTGGSELGDLREASVEALIMAAQKPAIVWRAEDLNVDLSRIRRTRLLKLFIPPRQQLECEIIEAESAEEAGANLALRLRGAAIL